MRESIPYTSYAMLRSKLTELGLVGEHPEFTRALRMGARCADHSEPVLILGERGVGKKTLSRLIHELGRTAPKPLRYIDCCNICTRNADEILFRRPKDLASSSRPRYGALFDPRFRTVHIEGFEFLSERLQARLLGVVDRRLRRLRAAELCPGKALLDPDEPRLLLSLRDPSSLRSHRHEGLHAVCEELLRNCISMPALARRRMDILPIARYMLKHVPGKPSHGKRLSPASERYLLQHSYSRNLETLSEMIRNTVATCPGPVIEPEDLERSTARPPSVVREDPPLPELNESFSLENYLRDVRRSIIDYALRKTQGNQSQAARLLQVSPQAVHQFLKTHGRQTFDETSPPPDENQE